MSFGDLQVGGLRHEVNNLTLQKVSVVKSEKQTGCQTQTFVLVPSPQMDSRMDTSQTLLSQDAATLQYSTAPDSCQTRPALGSTAVLQIGKISQVAKEIAPKLLSETEKKA